MKKWTQNDFLKCAIKVHDKKYDYSQAKYINNVTKIEIICPEHGKFLQAPRNHISLKQGCPLCGNKRKGQYQTKTTVEFIKQAKKIYGDTYNYSKVDYKKTYKKICIICKKHGEFYVSPKEHLYSKSGCPKCRLSKGEQKTMSFLEENKINYVRQKTLDRYKKIDKFKTNFCKQNNISLLRISYKELYKIEKVLKLKLC